MRQICKACKHADHFDFHVPDQVWKAVVDTEYRKKVVCLGCFDAMANQKGIKYASSLDVLFFAGERACFEFRVVTASD